MSTSVAEGLTFEPEGHIYRLGGKVLPSVTQVLSLLEDFSAVRPDVLEAARIFGQHVHEACALDLRGRLDWASLDPDLVPYVESLRRFLKDSGFKIIASECRVVHRAHGFAGTLDLYGLLSARRVQIDIKSGAMPRTVGPQTAAYEQAMLADKGAATQARYCLQLNPEFRCGYKLHPLTQRTDWHNFLSALNCWRFRNAA